VYVGVGVRLGHFFVCEHVVYVGVLCVWKIAGIPPQIAQLQERTTEKNMIAYNVTVLQTKILRKLRNCLYRIADQEKSCAWPPGIVETASECLSCPDVALLCFWHQIRNQSPYPRSPNLACFI
jgi:hypothetical protein